MKKQSLQISCYSPFSFAKKSQASGTHKTRFLPIFGAILGNFYFTYLLRWRQSGRNRDRSPATRANPRARGPLGPQIAYNSGRKCSTGGPLWSRRGRAACGTCSVPAPLPRSSGCTGACTRCAESLPCTRQIWTQKKSGENSKIFGICAVMELLPICD